jgi:hypothetical protein
MLPLAAALMLLAQPALAQPAPAHPAPAQPALASTDPDAFRPNPVPSAAEILRFHQDNWHSNFEGHTGSAGGPPVEVRSLSCHIYREFSLTWF